jgi:hypothetical protein
LAIEIPEYLRLAHKTITDQLTKFKGLAAQLGQNTGLLRRYSRGLNA